MLSCARKPAIWCIATDKAGNLSEPAAFTVTVATVRNTVAPMIVPPAAIMVGTKNGATYVGAIGAATASDNVSSGTGLAITSNAPAAFPLGMTLVTWTATDAAGNSSSASQLVTVVDDDPPTITVPDNVAVTATGPNGAVVVYQATAQDAIEGPINPSCAPVSGSTFPIGTTSVVCTATDAAGNTASATFTATVSDVTTPGVMHGDGFLLQAGTKYEFQFRVVERALSGERGHLRLRVNYAARGRRDDRFVATAITFVAFSDDPTFRPGRPPRPNIDTVLFAGTGEWNGQSGYRFEARATDQGEPGRHRETFAITVWNASGQIVATADGELAGGNVQSVRVKH
jgi:hypothetical protein